MNPEREFPDARFTLFGSSAIEHLLGRKVNDLDYLVWGQGVKPGSVGITVKDGVRTEYFALPQELESEFGEKATPEQMLAIKESHFPWGDKKSRKTALDIERLHSLGVIPDVKLRDTLRVFWQKFKTGKERVNLKDQSANEFFNAAVDRKMDHDDLHKLLSIHGTPLYLGLLIPGQEVWMSKSKFLIQDFTRQIDTAREEAIVLTVERNWGGISPYNLEKRYRKTCFELMSKMSKGWFSYFIADNWSNVIKLPFSFESLKLDRLRLHDDFSILESQGQHRAL